METKFRQVIRLFSMAAAVLLMTACGNDDNISSDQPAQARGIPFTATISNGGSATRALSGPNSSNVITATWTIDEEVALVYKIGDDLHVTKAKVTAVSDGNGGKTAGTATITATLDEGVTQNANVTLIYPYSAVDLTAGANYGKVKNDVFEGQEGTIAYISANCDLRKGEGKITLSTGSATLKENVTMASQIAIWNISLQSGGNALSATKLYVYFGGMTAMASKSWGGASFYFLAVPAGSTGLTILATAADGTYIYNKASVTLAASTYYQSTVTLTKQTTRTITTETGELTLQNGDIVTGTGGANTQLKIKDGATVTLAGVTNTDFGSADNSIDYGCRTGIECLGNATIILADGTTNTFKGHWERAAVFIPSGNTLSIRGGGTLIADNDGANGAGIGGSYHQDCGNIVIEGGNITAKGSSGAGIGSGYDHSCGTITIKGGIINATGGGGAAGIGSGDGGSCVAITISGGTITANGGDEGAGIGSGLCGKCGNISISGGTIKATGGFKGAGIGSGNAGDNQNTCGDITISGGNITATGGDEAAGIGSGNANNATNTCGDISISGGTITATGGNEAAGIGTGSGPDANKNGICGAISITAGTVEATGGDRAAGIGSGSCGKFTRISIGSGITRVAATRSNDFSNVPIGKGFDDQGNGAVKFGGVEMYDGTNIGWEYSSNWTHWPEDGGPFGGILVTASNYGTNNGRTWTLTPAP